MLIHSLGGICSVNMKISINSEEIISLSDHEKNVIKNDIHADIFQSDMKRRIIWSIEHPIIHLVEKNKTEWMKKFKDSYPSDPIKFASLFIDLEEPFEFEGSDLIISCDGVPFYTIPVSIQRFIYKFISQDPEYNCERIIWIVKHKYERCLERMRREWEPKLGDLIHSDPVLFANSVFSKVEYKDRKSREIERETQELDRIFKGDL